MFLNFFDDFHSYVLALLPINSTPNKKKTFHNHQQTSTFESAHLVSSNIGFCVPYTYPLHFMISGPSNPNGSSLSGSDLMTYSFVNNVLVKKSFGSK